MAMDVSNGLSQSGGQHKSGVSKKGTVDMDIGASKNSQVNGTPSYQLNHTQRYLAFADIFREFGFDITLPPSNLIPKPAAPVLKSSPRDSAPLLAAPKEAENNLLSASSPSTVASPSLTALPAPVLPESAPVVAEVSAISASLSAVATPPAPTPPSTEKSSFAAIAARAAVTASSRPVSSSPTAGIAAADASSTGAPEAAQRSSTSVNKTFSAPSTCGVSVFDALLAEGVRNGIATLSTTPGSISDVGMSILRSRVAALSALDPKTTAGALFNSSATRLTSISAPYHIRGVLNRRGVDCYVNAVLQALLTCSPLMKLLSHAGPGSQARPVTTSISRFASEFFAPSESNQTTVLNPEDALSGLDEAWGIHCSEGGQQDACEFALWLLDRMHMETLWENLPGKGKSVGAFESVDSPIHRLFGFITRSVFKNKSGETQAPRDEIEIILPLSIDDSSEENTLESSFDSLFKKEILEDGGEISRRIMRLPQLLVCYFKRTTWNENGGQKKIDKFVEYPCEFTVPEKYLDESVRRSEAGMNVVGTEDIRGALYDLIAVVGHHGKGADEGHYNAYIRQPSGLDIDESGGWLSVDDSQVRRMTDGEWMRCQGAYLLFYVRRNSVLDVSPMKDGRVKIMSNTN